MSRHRRRRHRGVSLFIMLLALIFLGLFLVVSARLFGSVTRTSHSAHEAERELTGFESALRALRRDAWGASGFVAEAEGAAVSIESPNGPRVRWHSDDDGALARTVVTSDSPEQVRRWPRLGGRLRFAAADPVLVVSTVDARGAPGPGELRLVSQILLSSREAGR